MQLCGPAGDELPRELALNLPGILENNVHLVKKPRAFRRFKLPLSLCIMYDNARSQFQAKRRFIC